MHRRTTATVILLIALLIAGCTGGPSETGPATEPSTGATDAPTANGAATASPTPTPNGPVYDLPLDGAALSSTHNATLQAAGSYTAETNVTIVQGSSGETVSVQATSAVDVSRGTMLVNGTTGGIASQVTYVGPDGSAYQRVETVTGEVQYQQLEDAPDVTAYFQLPVANLVEQANFTYTGRDRVAGTPVAVYEVTDLESLVAPVPVSSVDTGSLQAFEVSLAVSDDGMIRRLDYRVETEIDGSKRTIAMSIIFRDVGSTTVEPPDWLNEAR